MAVNFDHLLLSLLLIFSNHPEIIIVIIVTLYFLRIRIMFCSFILNIVADKIVLKDLV